jgi:very-short-patch-repair endonuclease
MPSKSPGGGLLRTWIIDSMKKGNSRKQYSPRYVIKLARKMRISMTPSEKKLWEALSNKKLDGMRFRSQHPIGRYIADFYCHAKKLIVEVDGGIHDLTKEYDKNRDQHLAALGYHIIRVSNKNVIHNLNSILLKIKEKAQAIEKRNAGVI